MDKWVGKVAVVTGASAGIGAAITKELASKGMIVIGLARRIEKVEEIAAKNSTLKNKIFAIKCDISDLKSIKEAFKKIEEKFEKIHVLVNNAGTIVFTSTLDESEEAAERITNTINLNFTGLVHCTREAIRLIKKSNDYGMIINISSVVDSVIPFGHVFNVYPATKHAVRAFSEVLRQELITAGNDKIRISNLSPGVVDTEIFVVGNIAEELPGNFKDALTAAALSAENVAEGVAYLLSTPTSVNVTQISMKPIMEKF